MGRAQNAPSAVASDRFADVFGARRGGGGAARDEAEARLRELAARFSTCILFEHREFDDEGELTGEGSEHVTFETWAVSCVQDWQTAFDIADRMLADGHMQSVNGSELEGFIETYTVTRSDEFSRQLAYWREQRVSGS